MLILLIIISFFLPSEITSETSAVIEKPPRMVFEMVNNPRNWKSWSAWDNMDPDMKSYFDGEESGVGSSHRWESDNPDVGNGSWTIIESEPYKSITLEFDFGEHGKAIGSYIFERHEEGTTINSSFTANLSEMLPPMIAPLMGPMFKSEIQKNTAQSFANMQSHLEGVKNYSVEIKEVELEPMVYLGIREPMPKNPAEIGPKMGALYGEIGMYIQKYKIEFADMPLTVYFIDGEDVEVECGIPIADDNPGNNRVVRRETAGGKTILAIHYGDYTELETTHVQLMNYIADNELTTSGNLWEQYITDPGQEPDTSKWITHVYYPIE